MMTAAYDIAPQGTSEPTPIWLAALIATGCRATRSGDEAPIQWNYLSGTAFYTNQGDDAELIAPFGVQLGSGQMLAVTWSPNETGYSVDVYGQDGMVPYLMAA